MEAIRITEAALDGLRAEVAHLMSESRYRHTLAVEQECAALAERYLPQKTQALRAAALLHDITKTLSTEAHLSLAKEGGISLPDGAENFPAILHSYTAEAVIRTKFSAFASEEIIRAVTRHTVGHPDMSLFDKILFLADYIEPTRKHESCLALRLKFYEELSRAGSEQKKIRALDNAVLQSISSTISHLKTSDFPILPDAYEVYKVFSERLSG